MDLPLVAPIHQTLNQPAITDLAQETRRQWETSSLKGRMRQGSKVAVAVGSRGIANLATLVRATLDYLRDLGAQPFIISAMGSHRAPPPSRPPGLLTHYRLLYRPL